MNRGAHLYLVGAVSGTALIAAAVIAFVLLISFQAVQEWPVSGIGLHVGDGGSAANDGGQSVGAAKPVSSAPNASAIAPSQIVNHPRTGVAAPSVKLHSGHHANGGVRAGGGGIASGSVGKRASALPPVSRAGTVAPEPASTVESEPSVLTGTGGRSGSAQGHSRGNGAGSAHAKGPASPASGKGGAGSPSQGSGGGSARAATDAGSGSPSASSGGRGRGNGTAHRGGGSTHRGGVTSQRGGGSASQGTRSPRRSPAGPPASTTAVPGGPSAPQSAASAHSAR